MPMTMTLNPDSITDHIPIHITYKSDLIFTLPELRDRSEKGYKRSRTHRYPMGHEEKGDFLRFG